MRQSYCEMIEAAGEKLRLPAYAVGSAMYFAHLFYASRSMGRNDRFLVATASLYLASKVEDPVRNVMEVVSTCFAHRHRGEPDAVRAFREDKGAQGALREGVLEAETALLHAIGFDFRVEQPYPHLVEFVGVLGLAPERDPGARDAAQAAWALLDDSRRTTLWLQYGAATLAASALMMACRLCKVEADWSPVWQAIGKDGRHHVADACSQLADLYEPGACGDLHMCISHHDSNAATPGHGTPSVPTS
ncbi:unnamed protein product [Ostreobium quekettii]|uniref:Cyclin N-terminal domain-containing protein n=1 Tax=Ostreobium quekettii TaxID=121088 RepID=A0A8S1IXX5_9CHLO|nr:unnamed protein product [Ostreobium quekettii]|eukprot:evm.model.scf_2378.3 EVM.evm.TU.scf_2378.3   scf_2378:14390-16749(-)